MNSSAQPWTASVDRSGAADRRVRLIARTEFIPPADIDFIADAAGGQALAEFAGRACYQSWDRPRPATATNAGYLQHIIEVGHLSILEHSSASFYLTGISRSVTHEILRHRHFSYSELSPRFTGDGELPIVEPPAVAADPQLHELFVAATEKASAEHRRLLEKLQEKAENSADNMLARRQVRQLAQTLFPGAAQTALVMTGNYRAWRHFIGMRATDSADVEIRSLAVSVLKVLQREAPNVFADFRVSVLSDGTEVAASPLVGEG